MSETTDVKSDLIGEGIDPGGAKVGSICWAVETAVRAIIATEEDPLKTAPRRNLVRKFEFAEGWNICSDYIIDCFVWGTTQKAAVLRSNYEVGTVLWAVELAVREIVAQRDDPRRTAQRRDMILGLEIARGRDINQDDILDFFTDATESSSDLVLPHHTNRALQSILPEGSTRSTNRSLHQALPESPVPLSNLSTNISIDYGQELLISLRSTPGTAHRTDMAMAQYHDGRKNYVLQSVAKRHSLQHVSEDKVQGYVGIENCFPRKPIVFEVKPSTKTADVLLGTEFHQMINILKEWEIPRPQEDSTPRQFQGRMEQSNESTYSGHSSQSLQSNPVSQGFLEKTIDSIQGLIKLAENSTRATDSTYGSDMTSSRSGDHKH
ncbi:hypothetical protein BX600DRAFT_438778 [Xylariales sp. PMI_506]|nr:hypothetical protein BX600DRAFT_438778 [Xylariales sp. PMI_506]